jgi:hypothetical protein
MASFHKFLIGDLVAYKNGPNADYLFGKDYGIVIGYGRGQENQIYYKIHWASDRSPNILSLFCYAQLDLIARTKEA